MNAEEMCELVLERSRMKDLKGGSTPQMIQSFKRGGLVFIMVGR